MAGIYHNSTLTANSRIMKEFYVMSLILEEIAGLPYPRRILEAGCGIGNLTPALRAMAQEVVAFDLSGAGIEIAKERHGNINNITFLVGDGTAPKQMREVAAGNFDLIFFREFHPYTREIYNSVQEAYAVHERLLIDYIDLLSNKGVVVIQHMEVNEQSIRPEMLTIHNMELLLLRVDPRLLAIFFVLFRNRVKPALYTANFFKPLLWHFSKKNICYYIPLVSQC